ncbi:MAG: D-tyrosyl-tRNA(Tyr) deacylase [Planctomycetota bacterium]|jgi:D-tyrosyl-tRNA(Tyr) deacylase|nr:D-tyrosyl-tRNA(Tyr) deacylase [Planctomycetota bacterium]
MRAVVQRVSRALVKTEGGTAGAIGHGLLVFLGVAVGDGAGEAASLAGKIVRLRIFPDNGGKMNHSLSDAGGAVLAVSQFTLCADLSRGNRPSFGHAAPPDVAKELFEGFCNELKLLGVHVEKGVFGARMEVDLVNNGPVTVVMDTDSWR